jgi:hypothetical protein
MQKFILALCACVMLSTVGAAQELMVTKINFDHWGTGASSKLHKVPPNATSRLAQLTNKCCAGPTENTLPMLLRQMLLWPYVLNKARRIAGH